MKTAAIIILSISLISIVTYDHVPQRILNRIVRPKQHEYSYLDNGQYIEQTDYQSIYSKPAKIVMFGNSLIYRVHWNELMNRDDIANRGIGSDITDGYIHRLDRVLQCSPSVCVIEGGTNDIEKRIDPKRTVANFRAIIDTLQQHNVKPVIMSVLYVGKEYPNAQQFNSAVKHLNLLLSDMARQKHVAVFDLNPFLSKNETTLPQYLQTDNLHLTSKGYEIWRDQLSLLLEAYD